MLDSTETELSPEVMANAIRALSMDAVQQANSGHPGMPMGMADVATVLFTKHLKYDPRWPQWPDRDRFILSAGHGSMLLYSLLHLTGYAHPTLDEIKKFRQLHSPTAGHPEYGMMPGIETTTGPLGQGLATSVGFAIAERLEAARSGAEICDHRTYVIAGDGCLMEGISQEAISLAGHLKLGKLIVLWDDNNISIDGELHLSTSEDQRARFEAAGWHVQAVDGHDQESVDAAIEEAKGDERPSLIACKTTIGFGSPNKGGKESSHGAPLGADEIVLVREALNWPHPAFEIPADIRDAWLEAGRQGHALSDAWKARFAALSVEQKAEYERRQDGRLPATLKNAINTFKKELVETKSGVASRKASEMTIGVIAQHLPEAIGGSADLTHSNLTKVKSQSTVTPDDFSGSYMHYGIREFGMAAAMNGIALHGGFIPYGGTFLVFVDYARPAVRLGALMGQRVIYVMTHDSIGLGEDGPTHQPVEHLASLRAMPNLLVLRPADAVETAEAWELALEHTSGPTILALSRQNLPLQRVEHTDANRSAEGGYILADAPNAKVTLVATGSEVHLAAAAKAKLDEQGVATRVVSLPSMELFLKKTPAERAAVLGDGLKVSIEAAATFGWERVVGSDGLMIGLDRFGESAPAGDLFKYFGFTADAVVEKVLSRLNG